MIKNLPRREFLRSAGITGIAISITNSVFAQKQICSNHLNGNIGFMDKIPKKTYSLRTLHEPKLLNIYEKTLNDWQNCGYKASTSDYYVCQGENLFLFPLHLNHESIGLLDSTVLCFGKNETGELIKLKPLSGFDLEALAVAAASLQKHNPDIDLGGYLLPSFSSNQTNSFCFNTLKGSVFIKTLLYKNDSNTEIIVKEGNKILFQQTIISEHRLSV
jgi:hypothetical protein